MALKQTPVIFMVHQVGALHLTNLFIDVDKQDGSSTALPGASSAYL